MNSIRIQGNPFALGKQHGEKNKALIRESIARLCSFPKISAENLERKVNKYVDSLERLCPEILEEAKGISSGAEVELEKIIELQLWEDLKDFNQGCTTIVFNSKQDGPVMGKTTDIEDWQQPYYILKQIIPDRGHKMVGIGKVGSSKIEIGLNEKGLVIGTGSAKPCDEIKEDAIERMTLVRLALQYCSNVKETIDFFAQHNFFNLGLYIVVLDRAGDTIVIEKSRSHQAVRYPDEKGVLYATNFYYLPEMIVHMDRRIFYYQNALERYITLGRLCNSLNLDEGIEAMEKILRDHSPVGPICAHFREIGMCSFYSYIVKPDGLVFKYTDGHPCTSSFEDVVFPA